MKSTQLYLISDADSIYSPKHIFLLTDMKGGMLYCVMNYMFLIVAFMYILGSGSEIYD